jgi:hypothetical protein
MRALWASWLVGCVLLCGAGLAGAGVVVAGVVVAAPVLETPVQLSATGSAEDFGMGADQPSLAYDSVSHRALAVWQTFDRPAGDARAVAAVVLDANGHAVGPQFVIPALANLASDVAVVARGRSGGFLVAAGVRGVDRASRLVSVVVSPQGLIGPARVLSPPTAFTVGGVGPPAIAFDARSDHAIVSWSVDVVEAPGYAGQRGGLFARAVDRSGRPAGPVRVLMTQPAASDSLITRVALIYEPARRAWLAVWSRDVAYPQAGLGGQDLSARLVDARAAPRGPVRVLAGFAQFRGGPLGPPVLASTAHADAALVMYTFDRDTGPRSVRVLLVRSDGRVITGPPGTASVPPTPAELSAGSDGQLAVFAPAIGRYVLVYSQSCNAVGHTQCAQYAPVLEQLLDTRGRRIGPAVTVAPTGAGSDSLVRTGSRTFLVAWSGVAASGPAYDGSDGISVYPQKLEIFARTVTP